VDIHERIGLQLGGYEPETMMARCYEVINGGKPDFAQIPLTLGKTWLTRGNSSTDGAVRKRTAPIAND
jgi:hypothetical protein